MRRFLPISLLQCCKPPTTPRGLTQEDYEVSEAAQPENKRLPLLPFSPLPQSSSCSIELDVHVSNKGDIFIDAPGPAAAGIDDKCRTSHLISSQRSRKCGSFYYVPLRPPTVAASSSGPTMTAQQRQQPEHNLARMAQARLLQWPEECAQHRLDPGLLQHALVTLPLRRSPPVTILAATQCLHLHHGAVQRVLSGLPLLSWLDRPLHHSKTPLQPRHASLRPSPVSLHRLGPQPPPPVIMRSFRLHVHHIASSAAPASEYQAFLARWKMRRGRGGVDTEQVAAVPEMARVIREVYGRRSRPPKKRVAVVAKTTRPVVRRSERVCTAMVDEICAVQARTMTERAVGRAARQVVHLLRRFETLLEGVDPAGLASDCLRALGTAPQHRWPLDEQRALGQQLDISASESTAHDIISDQAYADPNG